MNEKVSNLFKLFFVLIIISFAFDFFLSILYHIGLSPIFLKSVYYLRDIIILFYGIFSILNLFYNRNLMLQDFILLFLVFLIIGYSFIGNYSIMLRLASLRSYFIPFFLYFIGRNIIINNNTIDYIYRRFEYISILLIITSLADKFFIPISFWADFIQIAKFNTEVKGVINLYKIGSLPGNFYTANIRRVVGLATEPLALSYFIIIFLCIEIFSYFFWKKKKYLILALLIFIVQIFTLTRAVIIGDIFAFLIIFLLDRDFRNNKKTFKIILIIILSSVPFWNLIINFVYKTITFNDGGSAATHYMSLSRGFISLLNNIIGIGTGGGSTAATAIANNVGNLISSENSYLNISIETGILGLILFILFLTISVINIWNNYKKNKDNKLNILYIGIFATSLIWLLTGLFSPELWATKASAIFWLFFGMVQKNVLIL